MILKQTVIGLLDNHHTVPKWFLPQMVPTDWDSLPEQRRAERKEATELELAKDVAPPLDPEQKIDLNSAPRDVIMQLPGIGETLANGIIEGRPYQTIESVTEVNGIGAKTLQRIRPFLKLSE